LNKFMQTFLDQVAERVTALIARLVASHIEVKCAEHQAEVQCRIDELAARYDEVGQTEVAAHLRNLRLRLASDSIVPSGEALLNQIQNQTPVVGFGGTSAAEQPGQAIRQRRSASKRVLSLVPQHNPETPADSARSPQA
jgi:hypothetical protein